MPSGTESTTTSPNPTPTSTDAERNLDNINSIEPTLSRSTSHDPSYVQRARVTRAAPPKPACNPLQFIQIKPCNLYQSAQEQLKRAEEVKKVKETKKEEPEDWQSNLDNWKSCRRKRVEHIIDRVVEVKKLELEEHDRARKKSKTFSEMMEDRNIKGRKVSLAVYVDDEANDLSDLGIGTSTASGKSSLSEDFDNNSVLSDNQDNEKSNFDIDNQGNDNGTREYVSSPGYDTSSTHPPSSPDLCEYTYEGAIQDYKSRVSRAQKCGFTNNFYSDNYPKDSNHESNGQTPRKQTSIEIENRLSNFEAKTSSEIEKNESLIKKNLPKVDIARRRELFEKDKVTPDKQDTDKVINNLVCDFSQTMSIKERLMNLESRNDSQTESCNTKVDCLNTEFGSVKDRLLDIEQHASINQNIQPDKHAPIDVPVTSLKDRLYTLQEMVPSNANDTNDLVISTEIASNDDQTTKINNENINNNNHVMESMEESFADGMEETETSVQVQVTEIVEQPPVPDVVQEEQPNRLLSTINEAIHLVEDQPENIVKRDASVSSPNLFKNHVLDDIVVDNQVIDDIDDSSNTNLKSYLVMDHSSTSDNIVNTSLTDDTAGNEVLTTAGESLCISSNATFIDCCRQQSVNNEILNKVDVMYLRSPVDESNTLKSLADEPIIEIVKPVESEPVLARNGEITLNFIELQPVEGASLSNTDILTVESVGHLKHNDNIFTDETPITPAETSDSSCVTKESSASKNDRIKCQIVGVLEKHKCPSDASASRSDLTLPTTLSIDTLPSPDHSLHSPSKSPHKSSKTIFDFIKRNLLNDPVPPVAKDDEVNSTFYVPLIEANDSEKKPSNSCYEKEMVDESTEINILIDEELEKLD